MSYTQKMFTHKKRVLLHIHKKRPEITRDTKLHHSRIPYKTTIRLSLYHNFLLSELLSTKVALSVVVEVHSKRHGSY